MKVVEFCRARDATLSFIIRFIMRATLVASVRSSIRMHPLPRLSILLVLLTWTASAWDGSLDAFVSDAAAFCTTQGFGKNSPYICAGGGVAGGGGSCDAAGSDKLRGSGSCGHLSQISVVTSPSGSYNTQDIMAYLQLVLEPWGPER